MDLLLDDQLAIIKSDNKKAYSARELKGNTHNKLNDKLSNFSTPSKAESHPGLNIDYESKLVKFHKYLDKLKQAEVDKNNRGDQYEDPEEMNIIVSARDPPPII